MDYQIGQGDWSDRVFAVCVVLALLGVALLAFAVRQEPAEAATAVPQVERVADASGAVADQP